MIQRVKEVSQTDLGQLQAEQARPVYSSAARIASPGWNNIIILLFNLMFFFLTTDQSYQHAWKQHKYCISEKQDISFSVN